MAVEARTRSLRIREAVGHVLIAVVVIGLIALVYWTVTDRPCPRYPGIEKLRGGAGSLFQELAGVYGSGRTPVLRSCCNLLKGNEIGDNLMGL